MNKLVRDIAPATPRKAFTKKQRAEAFLSADGRCGLCAGKIIGQFDIDHIIALDHGGAHEPSNWRVVHRACHINKTRGDVKISAKIKRIQKRESGERKPRKAIPSRGFDKTRTKGFDGKVRVREALLVAFAAGSIFGGLSWAYLAGRSAAQTQSLATINRQENRAHRYGEPTMLGIDGVYDCEDYAWAKWRAVQAAGLYPREAMRVVLLTTRYKELHAVLVVQSPGGLVVLDNRYSNLATVRDLERNGDRPVNGWWPG